MALCPHHSVIARQLFGREPTLLQASHGFELWVFVDQLGVGRHGLSRDDGVGRGKTQASKIESNQSLLRWFDHTGRSDDREQC
jgi:hypothetical protein